MTQKRKGMTTVVDREGRLAGVITDGDLRRLHLQDGSIDDLTAGQVASREPKMIRADDLAAKALEVMETWQITSLVILDQARRPVASFTCTTSSGRRSYSFQGVSAFCARRSCVGVVPKLHSVASSF